MIARRLCACSIVLLLSAASPALAAPGDLDPTFGTGGVALGPIASHLDDVVQQPDGKLVVAGNRTAAPLRIYVARYETDGTLDATFGTAGIVETTIDTGDSFATAVVLQPDGKIVVAGASLQGPSNYDFALARYETDGSLDATFGTGGIVIAGGPTNEFANALVLQSDGKLVAAGERWNGSYFDFALARFETDGTLDATFGTGGWVIGPDSEVDAILQQPDGKLVVAGYQYGVSWNRDFAVARYETDGSLDPSFGTGGVVKTSISIYHDQAYGIVRQADGGFVVGGWSDNGLATDRSLVLVRYDATGVLDATFGTGGISTKVPDALYQIPLGLTEQPDGKLVMAAHTIVDGVGNIAVVRWQANGTLDTAFGNGGVVSTRISTGGGDDVARAVLLQPDGRIVAAGSASAYAAVVRYESGLCCTGGPCAECGVCEACGLAGCEPAPVDTECPDDGNVCTTEGCDGAGTCLHPPGPAGVPCPDEGTLCTNDACDAAGTCIHTVEPAPVCDEPHVAGAALLKIRSSAAAGKDRVQFRWAKGSPPTPVNPYPRGLCVYDRSGGAYSSVYHGSPYDPDGVWTFRATSNFSIRYKSKTGAPDGIKGVVLKFSADPTKSKAQVKAAGDLTLPALPLQHDPSVVAQIRWASGQCWSATFSSPSRSDAEQFRAKSD